MKVFVQWSELTTYAAEVEVEDLPVDSWDLDEALLQAVVAQADFEQAFCFSEDREVQSWERVE